MNPQGLPSESRSWFSCDRPTSSGETEALRGCALNGLPGPAAPVGSLESTCKASFPGICRQEVEGEDGPQLAGVSAGQLVWGSEPCSPVPRATLQAWGQQLGWLGSRKMIRQPWGASGRGYHPANAGQPLLGNACPAPAPCSTHTRSPGSHLSAHPNSFLPGPSLQLLRPWSLPQTSLWPRFGTPPSNVLPQSWLGSLLCSETSSSSLGPVKHPTPLSIPEAPPPHGGVE